MSQIVIGKDMVWLAGQVVRNESTPGITEQTHQILVEIDRFLQEAGTDKSRIVQAQIWLADIGDYQAFNTVWDDWVDSTSPPARACVEARLAQPHYRVEVMVTALL